VGGFASRGNHSLNPEGADPVKRLATLWLICAAIGFAVAAGIAVVAAFTVDGPGPLGRTMHLPREASARG
jgi:hypothetical protein